MYEYSEILIIRINKNKDILKKSIKNKLSWEINISLSFCLIISINVQLFNTLL